MCDARWKDCVNGSILYIMSFCGPCEHTVKTFLSLNRPLKYPSIPDFIGCMFFDLTVLYAFGNTLFIGANVLQLGGILTFTGCTFLENTLLGVENGVGLVSAEDRRGRVQRNRNVPRVIQV